MANELSELFYQTSIPKNLIIEFENGEVIENDRIYSESMELTECICSTEQLTFGTCESNSIKITLSDTLKSHKNLWFNAYLIFDNDVSTKYPLGKFYVVDDKAQADHSRRVLTAYDLMYHIVNVDVSSWYNGLTFPLTLKSLRTSFSAFIGVSVEDRPLINDSMLIDKTIEPSELKGSDVLSAYCEINGVFPNITRNGKLEYISLPLQDEMMGLYPKNDLFPDDTLFPRNESGATRITKNKYISCDYDEFKTSLIDKVNIRTDKDDIGVTYGSGNNCYIIENNFLVYGMSTSDLSTVAENLYTIISKYAQYRPFNCDAVGNLEVKVGEGIRLTTKYEIVESIVFKRTIKGIQSLRDKYEAKGVETYNNVVNGVNSSILQLKKLTNSLTRTLEETKMELVDLSNDTQSQFKQTAEQISLKVSKGDISSEISQESGIIKISANRFILDSTNCKISADGTITAMAISGGAVNQFSNMIENSDAMKTAKQAISSANSASQQAISASQQAQNASAQAQKTADNLQTHVNNLVNTVIPDINNAISQLSARVSALENK